MKMSIAMCGIRNYNMGSLFTSKSPFFVNVYCNKKNSDSTLLIEQVDVFRDGSYKQAVTWKVWVQIYQQYESLA